MAPAAAPCCTSSVSSSLSFHPSPAPSSPTSSTSSQSLRKRKRDKSPTTPVTPPPDPKDDVPVSSPMFSIQIFTSLWESLKSLTGAGSTVGDSATGGDEVSGPQPKRVRVGCSSDSDLAPNDQRNKEPIASTTHPVSTQDPNIIESPRSPTNNNRASLRIKASISIDKQAPPTQQLPSPLASSSEDEGGVSAFKKPPRPVRSLPKMASVIPLVAGPLTQNEPPFFTKPLPKRNNPKAMIQRALDRRSAFGSPIYPRFSPTYQQHSDVPKVLGTPLRGVLKSTPSAVRARQQIRDSLKTLHTGRHASTLPKSTRRNQRRSAYGGRVEKSVREAYMKSKTLNLNELTVILDQLSREKVQGFQSLSEVERRRQERAVEIERLRKKELEDKSRERIPPLTLEQKALYDRVMRDVRNPMVEGKQQYNAVESKIPITKSDLARLGPNTWLNDEIINLYLGMIADRVNMGSKPKKIIAFNSFFFKNLEQGKNVARWAGRQGAGGKDMLKLDYIIIPINLGDVHWVMAIVNVKLKRFEYYDSYRSGLTVKDIDAPFALIRRYVQAETGADLNDWTNYVMPNAPQQRNNNDCGVFSIKTAEVVTRGGTVSFAQKDMQLLRQRLVVECVTGKLLPPVDDRDGSGDDDGYS